MAEEIIDIRDRIEKMRIQIENEATEQISVNVPLEAHQKTNNSNISLSIENKNTLLDAKYFISEILTVAPEVQAEMICSPS